jgi:hypothetical protein
MTPEMTPPQNPFEAMWNDYSSTWWSTFEYDGNGFDYSLLQNASRMKRPLSRNYGKPKSPVQNGRCHHSPASSRGTA